VVGGWNQFCEGSVGMRESVMTFEDVAIDYSRELYKEYGHIQVGPYYITAGQAFASYLPDEFESCARSWARNVGITIVEED
jgi:hypothetical protein